VPCYFWGCAQVEIFGDTRTLNYHSLIFPQIDKYLGYSSNYPRFHHSVLCPNSTNYVRDPWLSGVTRFVPNIYSACLQRKVRFAIGWCGSNVLENLCHRCTVNCTEDVLYHRARLTKIVGADSGKLSGKTLAIKDNIHIAGVPLCCGSNFMRGFISSHTATVVSRILHAGRVYIVHLLTQCSV